MGVFCGFKLRYTLQSPQWCVQYHIILGRDLTALGCTWNATISKASLKKTRWNLMLNHGLQYSFKASMYAVTCGDISKSQIQVHMNILHDYESWESFVLCRGKDLSRLNGQYHGCWCHVDAMIQGISNCDIYFVELSWIDPRTLRAKILKITLQKFAKDVLKYIFLQEICCIFN